MSVIPPGTNISVETAASPGASSTTTGTFFVALLTQHGPVGIPIQLGSLSDFVTLCGGRVPYSPGYDVADLFFSSGGQSMVVSRYVGPAATAATCVLRDTAATPAATLNVTAVGPGVDGNNLSVAVIVGPFTGTYQLQVLYNGAVVETSPPLVSPGDAAHWGTLNPAAIGTNASKWVTITAAGSALAPAVVAPVALVGGADDNTNAGDTQVQAALNALTPALGPGQVAVPGRTTSATYEALIVHGATNNRISALDFVPGQTAAQIATAFTSAQGAAITAGVDPSYAAPCAPYITWPGVPTGTPVPSWPRSIPASAAFAALCAANDDVNDCNVACAGNNGILNGAIGVSQQFSDSDRAKLNNAGVNVFRQLNGQVQMYGWTSLAADPNWTDLSSSRFRMQLVNDANIISENYLFAQIDGAGQVLGAFNGDLTSMLGNYYAVGSLYGATAADAFSVNTGPTVNTAATIAARQLNAVISVVMSPSAQNVNIEFVKYLVGATI